MASPAEPREDSSPESWGTADPFAPTGSFSSTQSGDDSDMVAAIKTRDTGIAPDELTKKGTGERDEWPPMSSPSKAMSNKVKPKFHLEDVKASGPSKLFNPTNVRVHMVWDDENVEKIGADRDSASTLGPQMERTTTKDLIVHWTSRDSRKGRNSVVHSSMEEYRSTKWTSRLASQLKKIAKGHWTMFSTFPYWNMAFWSGWSYTIGSCLFVVDGAWSWGPLAFPGTEFPGESEYGIGFLFFFGALFYEVGAVIAYLEAINDGSWGGSAMRRFLEGHDDDHKKILDDRIHRFFGGLKPLSRKKREQEKANELANNVDPEAGWRTRDRVERPGSVYPADMTPAPRRGGVDLGEAEEGETVTYLTWRWWPTWERLKTHHIRDIGWLACTIQLIGATLYAESGTVCLPGILINLSQGQENGAYWIPQTVASVCFLTASVFFTVETQEKWYKPEFHRIGWWIGFWAGVGSMGFL